MARGQGGQRGAEIVCCLAGRQDHVGIRVYVSALAFGFGFGDLRYFVRDPAQDRFPLADRFFR